MSCSNNLKLLFPRTNQTITIDTMWVHWTVRGSPSALVLLFITSVLCIKTTNTRSLANTCTLLGSAASVAISLNIYHWFDMLVCNNVDIDSLRYVTTIGVSGASVLALLIARYNWAIVSSLVLWATSTGLCVGDYFFRQETYSGFYSNSTFTASDASQVTFNVQVLLCVTALCCLLQTRSKRLPLTQRRSATSLDGIDFSEFEPTYRHSVEANSNTPRTRDVYK
jgi:hypothetical protein